MLELALPPSEHLLNVLPPLQVIQTVRASQTYPTGTTAESCRNPGDDRHMWE